MNILQQLQNELGKDKVRENEPMSNHTTFKIGGPSEYYTDVDSLDVFIKAVKLAKKLDIPVFVFGGGSNIIVSDKGIQGLTIKNNCRKFEIKSVSGKVKNSGIDMDKALLYVESGAIMNQLVRFCVDNGLAGLEYHLGLPGTVGGGVFMNSNFPKKGSYVGDCLQSARLLTVDGEVKEVEKSYFRFGYDKSILQETGEIVLSVIFKLSKLEKEELLNRSMEALTYRTSSQPKGASAGCTFRNISIVEAITIPTPENITSAGFLIDKSGLKGKRIGGAMVSDKHANFILNMGEATAEDVVSLANFVKEEVLKKCNVKLHFEVRTAGF